MSTAWPHERLGEHMMGTSLGGTTKGVLIDVDGTLLDSNDAHALAWQQAFRESGREIAFEKIRPLIGKGGDKLQREVADLDAESEEGQRIAAARRRIFEAEHLAGLKATRGARDLLLRLRTMGLQLMIATSAEKDELASLLRQAGVDDLIEQSATSGDAEASKPDPDIVHAALQKSGMQAAEVFMLGDTPFDIDAARAAGVRTVVLRCGGWWKDDAFASAVAVYDDPAAMLLGLDELLGARSAGT